jgi:hypothetical protein
MVYYLTEALPYLYPVSLSENEGIGNNFEKPLA